MADGCGAVDDGASLLRVDLNNTSGVERVRVRLGRPDLGTDLLDTRPTGDGGWMLTNDQVAIPGLHHPAPAPRAPVELVELVAPA